MGWVNKIADLLFKWVIFTAISMAILGKNILILHANSFLWDVHCFSSLK